MSLDDERTRRREPPAPDTSRPTLRGMHLRVDITLPGTSDRADENALGQLHGLPAGTPVTIHITERPPGCRIGGMLRALLAEEDLRLTLAGSPAALKTWWALLGELADGIA